LDRNGNQERSMQPQMMVSLRDDGRPGAEQTPAPSLLGTGGSSPYLSSRRKRVFDIVVALVGLAVLLPLMGVVAILIRATSKGPCLFVQTRNGHGRLPFRILKFRSMYVADETSGPYVQARKGDSRITPIGKFIRSTSIDELPQFFNVIAGSMSVVGPRPHPVALDEKHAPVVAGYVERFGGKPGLTGLAQVSGLRGETPDTASMQRRIDADVAYLRSATLRMDIGIVWSTAMQVMFKREAY
jgi:putative colanic acid biosynthesis UDP-glucose lipid carrier transferase